MHTHPPTLLPINIMPWTSCTMSDEESSLDFVVHWNIKNHEKQKIIAQTNGMTKHTQKRAFAAV